MNRSFFSLTVLLLVAGLFSSCKKEGDTLDAAVLQEYFPISTGNVWIYQIDSIYILPFGTNLVEKSYHAKDSVTATFMDNQGRLSYIIWRFIRDTAGAAPWRFASTMHANITGKQVEYVENNLRYVKLMAPVREGFSWFGHAFIDTHTEANSYLDKANGWDYRYTNVGVPYSIFGKTYDSTITVTQIDETTPPGPFDPNVFKQRLYAREVYAKDVGLIEKELLFWTWQPPAPPPPEPTVRPGHYEDGSFGIRLRLISNR